ncbi:hypothetical protein BDV19DRAFT_367483 [Aspergillus venezuelensis]
MWSFPFTVTAIGSQCPLPQVSRARCANVISPKSGSDVVIFPPIGFLHSLNSAQRL